MSYNIPTTSWTAVMTNPPTSALASPTTIGSNVSLSQGSVVSATTYNFPVTTSPDTLVTNNDVATLTLKSIAADTNTLSGIWTSPIVQRYGDVQAGLGTTAGSTTVLTGALNQTITPTAAGSFATAFDNTEGLCIAFATTASANINGGLVAITTAGIGRRAFSVRVRSRAKVNTTGASIRRYFGFTSNGTLPITDTPLGAGDSGVLVGYRSTDAVWNIFNNDGSGAEIVTATTGTTSTDSAFHTIEINWAANGNANVILDGNVQTAISTRLPAAATNLFFNDVVQTTASASANTLTLHGTQIELGK
jgi:hypothetical protein